MGKKQKCPECPPEGAPLYMLTYGDMMTLLVTFFVLLISFSSMQEAKFQRAMSSLQGALGVLKVDAGVYVMKPNMPLYEFKTKDFDYKLKQIIKQLEAVTEKTGTHEMVRIEQSKDRIHFSISNPMLFNSGKAILKPDSYEILAQIAKILKMVPFEIRVEGHTDNIPIRTVKFPSNWELSSARALAIAKNFIASEVDPARLQVIGFGEFRPIATNDTPLGRAQNRRVEIYVNLKNEVSGSLFNDKALKQRTF